MSSSPSENPRTAGAELPTDIFPGLNEAPAFNIPNLITMSRLVLALILFWMIDQEVSWIACTVLFIVAASTDFLDGYLARKWNQITQLGRTLDPFVDKMIIGGTLIFLTKWPESGVSPWITFIVIAREMFVTGMRSVLEARGVDFSAKTSGKIKMVLQSIAVPAALLSLSPTFMEQLGASQTIYLQLRNGLLWMVVLITVFSGLEYVWRGWKLLKGKPGA